MSAKTNIKSKLQVLLFFQFITFGSVFGQESVSDSLENMFLEGKSPGIQQMTSMRYLREIDLSTGVIYPTIHLTKLTAADLDVDIDLNYISAQGNKVNDISDEVGLGWSLSCNNYIKRIVRGIPDETNSATEKGWLVMSNKVAFYKVLFDSADFNDEFAWKDAQAEYYKGVFDKTIDAEPDLFIFKIGNYSGSFVLDIDGNPVQINGSDIKIIPGLGPLTANPSQWSEWKLILPDGTQYLFNNIREDEQKAIANSSQSELFTTTIWLSKIISPTGSEINFEYESQPSYSYTLVNKVAHDLIKGIALQGKGNHSISDISEVISNEIPYRLKKISSDAGKVDFIYQTSARLDFASKSALQFVKQYDSKGIPEKSFEILTSYFNCDGTTNPCRLKLNAIKELPIGESELIPLSFHFKYNETQNLPSYNSISHDWWGYYNNNTDSSFIPFIPNCPVPGGCPGANRLPDFTWTTANILNQVVFPGGGFTSYTYELNTYSDGGVNINTGGLRIKQELTSDNEIPAHNTIKDYSYLSKHSHLSSGEIVKANRKPFDVQTLRDSIGQHSYCLRYSSNRKDLFNKDLVRYRFVTIKESEKGRTEYLLTSFKDKPDIPTERYVFRYKSETGDHAVLPISNNRRAYAKDKSNDAGSTNNFLGNERGKILREESFNDDSIKVQRKDYEYDFKRNTSVLALRVNSDYSFLGHQQEFYSYNTEYYQIINSAPRLKKITTLIYDQLDTSLALNKEEHINYLPESNYIIKEKLTERSDKLWDFIKYEYPEEIALSESYSNEDPEVSALIKMKNENFRIPIETTYGFYSTDTVAQIIKSDLITFKLNNNTPLAYQTYTSSLDSPVENFESSHLEFISNETQLSHNNNYRLLKTNDTYTNHNRPLFIKQEEESDKSFIWTDDGTQLAAEFANAKIVENAIGDEASYTGFEDNKEANYWGISSITTGGFTGKGCYSSCNNSNNSLKRVFKPSNQCQSYKFSAWIKIDAGFNPGEGSKMELYASNSPQGSDIINNYVKTLEIKNTSNQSTGWKYFAVDIDLGDLRNSNGKTTTDPPLYIVCLIKNTTVASTNCNGPQFYVDDICFRPSSCLFTTYNYSGNHLINSNNQNNYTRFFGYDEFNRLSYIGDQNRKLIKRIEYSHQDPGVISSRNSITECIYNSPFEIDSPALFSSIPQNAFLKKSIYLNGLGIPIQEVQVGASPEGRDVVKILSQIGSGENDVLFYKPYSSATNGLFKNNAINDQMSFYQTASKIAHTNYPFAHTVFETSPLHRLISEGGTGEDWQNHTKRINYLVNGNFEVRKWIVSDNTNSISGLTFYAMGQLFKEVLYDENDSKQVIYKDKTGRIIRKECWVRGTINEQNGTSELKDFTDGNQEENTGYNAQDIKLATDYIYNSKGQLVYIITPKAEELLASQGNQFSENSQDLLFMENIYSYKYDERERMIASKEPGKDWVMKIYNKHNLLALTQDGELRHDNKWLFNKYDCNRHCILTGIKEINETRAALQQTVDNSPAIFEVRNNELMSINKYSNVTYPNHSDSEILTLNYFDDYSWNDSISFDTAGFTYIPELANSTVGMATGSIVKILDYNQDKYLANINFYNGKGKIIQNILDNHLGGREIINIEHSFEGRTLNQTHSHLSDSGDQLLWHGKYYAYDKIGRILHVDDSINTDIKATLVTNEYNEIGELVKKKVHQQRGNNSGYEWLQKVDYRYNERGWITRINNASLVTSEDNADMDDVFGEEIDYNRIKPNTFYTKYPYPIYDGLPSVCRWKTKSPATDGLIVPERSYIYRYDNAKNLMATYYARNAIANSFGFTNDTGKYDEVKRFDANHNVKQLLRGNDDNISFNFVNQYSNHILSINDTSAMGTFDFPGGVNNNEYQYNQNGFISNNENDQLTYNYLNGVTHYGSSLSFSYDALGNKVREINNDDTLDFVKGLVFKNGKLIYIETEEGRARPKSLNALNNTTFVYDYFIKDHLNNVRAVVTEEVLSDMYVATMEDSYSQKEERQFYFIPETRAYAPGDLPADSSIHQRVSLVNKTLGRPIGCSKILSLMEGDFVSINARSYFSTLVGNLNNTSPVANIINQISGVFFTNTVNTATLTPEQITQQLEEMQNTFQGNTQLVSWLTNNFNDYDPNHPNAFLSYIFLDKGLKFIEGSSGVIRVSDINTLETLERLNIQAAQAGYLFVYVSNESGVDVCFDNLTIEHNHGPLLQLTKQYYPGGLFTEQENTLMRENSNNCLFKSLQMLPINGRQIYNLNAGWYDPATLYENSGSFNLGVDNKNHYSPFYSNF